VYSIRKACALAVGIYRLMMMTCVVTFYAKTSIARQPLLIF
jgi:hypothetical protein